MNRVQLLLLSIISAVTMYGQMPADGYYRVQNQMTSRYIAIRDNRGSVNMSTTTADFGALQTVLGFERVVSDPASIIYFKRMTSGYDIQAQGASSWTMIGYELRIYDNEDGTYSAYATSHGMTQYLNDAVPTWMMDDEEKIYGSVGTNDDRSRDWYIKPVKNADGYYFGINPEITTSDGYYKSFYADFPFSFASQGMNAYYVTKVDAERGCAVIKEITGSVPKATPVIVKCSSNNPANNKLNLLSTNGTAPSDNQLQGVYFCFPDKGTHTNVVAYNASTMRVLGKAADGSLAYVKQTGLQYVPANTAYLKVASSAPAELKVMTETQYNQMLAEEVTITAKNYTREYGETNPTFDFEVKGATLKGEPSIACAADEKSPVGKYTIKVAKGSVTNGYAKLVDGTLTITPAELTVTVADASRDKGADNPEFVLTYEGFKNGETESVLIAKPVATTAATKDSPAGVYDITVSGGQATNYTFKYVGGKLTVSNNDVAVRSLVIDGTFDVYDIYGKKILSNATTLSALRKGVYVVNGRKVIVQ